MVEGTVGYGEVSGGEIVAQQGAKSNPPSSEGYLCGGRENRGSELIGEAPESDRGLTRVQYPSRVNEKGSGRWLKVWTGAGRTVEV